VVLAAGFSVAALFHEVVDPTNMLKSEGGVEAKSLNGSRAADTPVARTAVASLDPRLLDPVDVTSMGDAGRRKAPGAGEDDVSVSPAKSDKPVGPPGAETAGVIRPGQDVTARAGAEALLDPASRAEAIAMLNATTERILAEVPPPVKEEAIASAGTAGAVGTQAILRSGALRNKDYPHKARKAGAEGAVAVRYNVGEDGRVRDCRVVQTSGDARLDETTCTLIERRFVYRPARDTNGRPTTETVTKLYHWFLAPRGNARSTD
jgi:protein TonB